MWFPLHFVLLAGLVALWLQANPRPWAATLEPIAVGWLAATLAGLAWWSGMTFLAGGAVAPGFSGELAHGLFGRGGGDLFTRSVSALLALSAFALLARMWPTLRHVLVLAATSVTLRWRLAMLAAVTVAWIIGSFYYQLALPLATKALVLVVAGAVLAALAWLAQGRVEHAAALHVERRPALWIAAAATITLLVVNGAIWQKEGLIAQGHKVYVTLAPVDPRSLMQGDYMRLAYPLPAGIDALPKIAAGRPYVVARLDARRVAQLLRVVQAGDPIAPGEMRIELTPKAGSWTLVSDAWLFREGDAALWQNARFAEFRVDESGRALLVGLADAQLRPIPIAP
jgi:uncharacterized membrane-anchored protein